MLWYMAPIGIYTQREFADKKEEEEKQGQSVLPIG